MNIFISIIGFIMVGYVIGNEKAQEILFFKDKEK